MTEATTAFQAIEIIRSELEDAGFRDMTHTPVAAGGAYYKIRNGSSIIAFRVPEHIERIRLVCAHSDSPCYKIKARPMLDDPHYTVLNTAPYGGMIHASFQDVPLGIAGRVCYEKDGTLVTRNVDYQRPVAMMNRLAIHLNRSVNDGIKLEPGKDMNPLFFGTESDLLKDIEREFRLPSPILTHDLYIYSAVTPYLWGPDDQLITSPRLDNLISSFSAYQALIAAKPEELAIAAIFNNEEVGSNSFMGAGSDFLYTTLIRIFTDLGLQERDLYEVFDRSYAISSDNAHAYHPNYKEKYDRHHICLMNRGVAIKYSANQKYTTDAVTAAEFKLLCERTGVNCQEFENHSAIPGGSTLGNILIGQVSIHSVDIGVPQLSMHSATETAGMNDVHDLIRIFTRFFSE